MKNGVCPKCQSTIIIQGVRVIDRGQGHVQHDLSVSVYQNPDAWIFKGQVTGGLWACICGACGFTELYASNLDDLLKAAFQGQPQSITQKPAEPPSEAPPSAS